MRKGISGKAISCILILAMILSFIPINFAATANASTGITFYADAAAGNDANSGTSPDQAFRTLFRAAQVLNPGDTLLIKGGIYADYFLIINKGSNAGEPITIRNYDNQPVIIHKGDNDPAVPEGWHGSGWTNNVIVYINNSSNIDISGLEIHYAGEYGEGMTPKESMTGFLIYGGSNIKVHDMTIRDTAQGISLRSNSRDIDIYNNKFYGNVSEGLKIAENAKNVRIYNNTIRNNETGTYISGASGSTLFNNLIYDNNLALRAENATGFDIINNTFSNATDMIFGDISGNRVINNILTNGMWSGTSNSYTNNLFDYNLYSGDAMNPMGAHDFKADPGFKDAANKDFYLTDESAAIRAGSNDGVPLFDFNGKERVSPADIGAYAYGNVYYASVSGSDSNSGSAAAPFATLEFASSLLQAGDTLYIKEGEYEDHISILNHTPAANRAPITIRNFESDQVTIKGQKAVNIAGSSNITLSGLVFDGNASVGPAVYLNNSSDIHIFGSQFTNADIGLQLTGNTSDSEIYNSKFDHKTGTGLQIEGSSAINVYNNIFNNRIGVLNQETVVANTYIINNVFHSYADGANLVLLDESTGNTVENNIFSGEAGKAIDIASSANFYSNNVAGHNLYNSANFAQLPANAGATDLLGDPKFADAANEDYHILRGGAGIDKGNDAVAPLLDGDGVRRYDASDIGAFEYVKPNVQITNYFPEGSGISVSSPIKITFADQLSPSVTGGNIADYIQAARLDGTAVPGSFQIGEHSASNGTTVTFTPGNAYAYETEYKVTVKGDIPNIYNDKLGQDFSWSFKTATQWGNDLVHPGLLFSSKDGTLQELQDSTLDYTETPYGISSGAIWDRAKTEAQRVAAEKFYTDQANRGPSFKNYYYFYYPYMLEPVNHDADNSLQIGDLATANSFAQKAISPPVKDDYFINFDYKPISPEKAKDYLIWSSFDGGEYDDIIVKMTDSKLYYTDETADRFVEVPDFSFANDTWYNIFIHVKANGTVNLMVNGNAVDVTSKQIGSGNMTAIGDLGAKADGSQGMAYFDNIRVYESYTPIIHEKFNMRLDNTWTFHGKTEVPVVRQPSHEEPVPTYYWTAITSDLQGRMQNLALAYMMLKDKAPNEAAVYGAKARDLIMSIAHWSVWSDPEEGETASLDTGYLTTGAALAFDMIYDYLTPEEKSVISKAIKEKGVDTLYKSATEPGSYGNYDGKDVPANTTFVQNAAMGLGALAIGKEYDASYALDRAREIIESAYRNGVDRDGAWVEGSIYGDLAIISALPFHDADARVTGHDVIRTGYLSKAIDFPIYTQFPSGRTYSMVADGGDWSYQYKKIMQYYAKYDLSEYAAWGLKQLNTMKNSGDFLSFIWNPGHKEPKVPTGDTKALGKLFNDMGLAAFKTGWGKTDTMANLKSSKRTGNLTHHTHLDQNSIELVRGDSQLLSDPAYQDYSAGPRQDFTLATGHNILVLDGKYQSTYGFGGQIENFYVGDKYGFSVGEAGLSYQSNPAARDNGDIPEWRRSLVNMAGGKYFVLFDDYQTDRDNRDLVWQLNTQGQVRIDTANSAAISRKGNDYLGIKWINADISKVKTEENLYAFPSAYVKKAVIVSVPKEMMDSNPALTVTIKSTSYADSQVMQHTANGTARIGFLPKSASFPSGFAETTFALNKDYADSIRETADMIDIRLDINEAVFIESMSVTDGAVTGTASAADNDADAIKEHALGISFEPGVWRDAFQLKGTVVRGNHASERIFMNAANGRENRNILTLLYPSGDGSMPQTEYLKDSDDDGAVISRDGATDLVLFHKDSAEPVVLADAVHQSFKDKVRKIEFSMDNGRVNRFVLKYKADEPGFIVQNVNGTDVVIGTVIGDGSERVDAFTLAPDPNGKAIIRFTEEVSVSDAWSASANRIIDVTDPSAITLANPDGYYDVTIQYKDASDQAVVKQDGVIIGRLSRNGSVQTIGLQKPYTEMIDAQGRRKAKVNIQVEGATVTGMHAVENSSRTQLGKTLNVGGDNDTAFLGYHVPGVSIVSKDPYKEVEPFPEQWGAKSKLDGIPVRHGNAGARMYVNSMNTRNLYKMFIKYQSAEDVIVYQYENDADKAMIGVLKGGSGWQIASLDLKGYDRDFNGYNYVTNRLIEFGGNVSVSNAWLELSSPDKQADYTIVGAAGDDNISKHTPGLAVGGAWGEGVMMGGVSSRTGNAGAEIFANITDLSKDYYVNVKYKSDVNVKILQKLDNVTEVQAGTLPVSSDWSVARIKMDARYFDSLGRDGIVTNIRLSLDGAAIVSDMWLEKDIRINQLQSIAFDRSEYSLTEGETGAASVQAIYENQAPVPIAAGITLLSADPEVAGIGADGVITAKKPGNATIIASYQGYHTSAQVTVKQRPVTPPDNRAPVFEALAPVSIKLGETVAFFLNASDADGDSITYSGVYLPARATLDGATGKFSWTPEAAGKFDLTFRAIDSRGAEGTLSVNISVTENSDSGNGSESGGSAGGVNPAEPAKDVTVGAGMLTVEKKPDSQGDLKVELNSEDLSRAIGQQEKGNLSITVPSNVALHNLSVNLPADSLRKGLAEHTLQSVTLNSGLAKIVLSADVLESAVKDDVKQVELSIATVTLSQLAESVKTRIGNNPVYDLSLSADGTPVSFTGKQAVTITMDYTLQPGEQADRIVVYFIDDNKGMQVVKNARYDAAAGKVTFSPNQFGKYTILHANVSFADLGAASWAQEPVLFLAAREIVDGVAEGSFQPNGQVTRAQFVKLLVEALDLKAEQADSGFTDTVEGAWYDSYVKTAKKLGIVNGREDGSFGVNDPIKREDLAVMINRALQYLKADLRGSSDYAVAFIDQDSISDYAREPIAELTRSGIVNGLDGGVFGPAKQATRAEAAVMIYRLLQFI